MSAAKRKVIIALFLATLLLSFWGLYRLFLLRFQKGDVFPPYSSLRSDPLGSKALLSALERSPGLVVRRNFRSPERIGGSAETTQYWLGVSEALLDPSEDTGKDLFALARAGNRLVIAFMPRGPKTHREVSKSCGDGEKTKGSGTAGKKRSGVWGIRVAPGSVPHPAATLAAARSDAASELPATIPFRSMGYFEPEAEQWKTLYTCADKPVVLERNVGKGSIVLLADSYQFSNEALRKAPSPVFLSWLQGKGRTALFDEWHLGVADQPGVMALIEKLRLVPLLLALIGLGLLHVWKSAVPFAGGQLSEPEGRERGHDNFSGLVNLLRRNVTERQLLDVCLRQWLRSFSRELDRDPELVKQLQAAVPEDGPGSRGKDPVARYTKIAGLLAGFRGRYLLKTTLKQDQ